MIHDPSEDELFKLRVDLETGESEMLPMPVINDTVANPDEDRDIRMKAQWAETRLFLEPLPRQGFKLKVLPIVDLAFQFSQGNTSDDMVAGIMAFTNTFFKHSNDFKIELEVLPTVRIPAYLPANPASIM